MDFDGMKDKGSTLGTAGVTVFDKKQVQQQQLEHGVCARV